MTPPPGGHDPEAPPRFQHMLDAGGMADDETEGTADMEEYMLLDGDIIMGKVTYALETSTGDAWATYGTQTRVRAGESEPDAFERLATIVGGRAAQLAEQTEMVAAQRAEDQRKALRERRFPTSNENI